MTETLRLLPGLVIILVGAKLVGRGAARLGQPPILGELLFGLLLGPSLLGWVPNSDTLQVFAQIGVVFLMFMAGLETDTVELRRSGRASLLTAVGGVVLPLGGGTAVGLGFGESLPAALFLGAILTATSVSISAETLRQLGRLRGREGTTILGAAIIDDVLGVIVLALVTAFTAGANPLVPLLQMAGFFAVMGLGGTWLLPRVDDLLVHKQSHEVALATILGVVLISAWAAAVLGGVAAITGAYLAGLLLGRTKGVHAHHAALSGFTHGFFAPIFFVSIGLQVQLGSLAVAPLLAGATIAVAIVTKLIGSGAGAWAAGLPPLPALRVGVGMISRGEVALIIAGIGLQSGLISPAVFAAAIAMTLVTTMITPVLLKAGFARPGAVPLPVAGRERPAGLLGLNEEG